MSRLILALRSEAGDLNFTQRIEKETEVLVAAVKLIDLPLA